MDPADRGAQPAEAPGRDLTALLSHALLADLDDTVFGKEFVIRKALGWALREHARTDAAWVLDFV
ncbi:DNA alkylation repair protein, partial [Nocardioides sp.]|uniref:DNA alkylation repair protein n=1 Tax=Nocardioides sp. TaxID=35761 RepID=UPI00286E19B6